MDLLNALNFGSSIRQTDATAINSKSSRSHAVFSLNFVEKKSRASMASPDGGSSVPNEVSHGESWVTVDSKLHFVDLAGSEKLKNSGLSGSRVKEGISINAGLASLGKVISQLSSRAPGSHVSFRDSRLTRLLQDSLGGNAITYMVACVNPIEFHLNETLNTVQYAQRARAIQSRPMIQQRLDEGEKQIIIDRLRLEVTFLREQIRLSERNDRRKHPSQDRNDRKQERANELQNQLLDVQESYSALSQRHAKLISEIAKGKSEGSGSDALKGALANSSLERLNRSNTFAEAVEQVVLEYEKTIQSLEATLSNTRSNLSTSESSLLEREAKIVYMEAVTQQLQVRIQKSMDREASSEHYLRDLEARLEGVSSGEEKLLFIIQDLRKKLARIRESESNVEEYISTLEERLAEAEQDTDVMQREIGRLEHVIERQRTISKMNSALHELDSVRHLEVTAGNGNSARQRKSTPTDAFHDLLVGTTSAHHPNGDVRPESAEEQWRSFGPMESEEEPQPVLAEYGDADQQLNHVPAEEKMPSPAQARAVADKLESITSELFDLKVDHESTVAELDDISRKYKIALSTLAELQDAVDEARQTRPTDFLEHAGMHELRENGQHSSSHMLSSDLSSLGESPTLVAASEGSRSEKEDSREIVRGLQREETLAEAIRRLKRLSAEKDINMAELTENYSQLQDQHKDTLNYIDELKEELAKAQTPLPVSSLIPVLRRGPSQFNTSHDRESRVFMTLRNLAVEKFEDHPETLNSFDANLNAVMAEAQIQSGRVQTLEAEVAAMRKEMDVKNIMISGLLRERSARPSGPLSMSLIISIRNQLLQTQNQISGLHETNAVREQDLMAELQGLKISLGQSIETSASPSEEHMPGEFPETPAPDSQSISELRLYTSTQDEIRLQQTAALRKQLLDLETHHQNLMKSNKAFEEQITTSLTEFEISLRSVGSLPTEHTAASAGRTHMVAESNVKYEVEKAKHNEHVMALQKEIDGYRATADAHAAKLLHLENSYAHIIKEVEEDLKSREITEKDLQTHRDLVMNLEDQIDQQKSLVTFHQKGLQSMQESHVKELDGVKAALAGHQAQSDARRDEHLKIHEISMSALQEELKTAHVELAELMHSVSVALNEEPDSGNLHNRIKSLADDRRSLSSKNDELAEALRAAQREIQAHKESGNDLQEKLQELAFFSNETQRQLDRSSEKEQKSSRLVQELEDQLHSVFNQHQDTSNRLSTAQKDRSEVEKELEDYRAKVGQLEVSPHITPQYATVDAHSTQSQLADMKRMTVSSISHQSYRESLDTRDMELSLRKSNSHASLPSPPPAVPLPPLPGNLSATVNGSLGSPVTNATSPPGSRHASKNIEATQLLEDQENRIRTIEKHLYAEKQLTQTLEEALVDLETQANKTKDEVEAWKKKCKEVEEEANGLRRERGTMRNSLQAVEEERDRRIRAEQARKQLEERMEALGKKTKKKGALNCF